MQEGDIFHKVYIRDFYNSTTGCLWGDKEKYVHRGEWNVNMQRHRLQLKKPGE